MKKMNTTEEVNMTKGLLKTVVKMVVNTVVVKMVVNTADETRFVGEDSIRIPNYIPMER
jgi:hypothetical protein